MDPSPSISLSELLDEIARDEEALARKRMVADFLRERLQREGLELHVAPSLPHAQPQGAFVESFSETLLKAVHELHHREFTVGDVYSILVARGVTFKSSTPKASIATALDRLVKTGVLKRTFKGSGTIPNRFRRADDRAEQDPVQPSEKEGDL